MTDRQRKAARLREHYRKLAKAFVRQAWYPNTINCPVMLEIAGERVSVDQVHHTRGRLGPLLIDERFWLAVSQKGHDFIHANPAIARAHGWLCQPGQWNTPPKDFTTTKLRHLFGTL